MVELVVHLAIEVDKNKRFPLLFPSLLNSDGQSLRKHFEGNIKINNNKNKINIYTLCFEFFVLSSLSAVYF